VTKIQRYLVIRARSVLPETEEPAVLTVLPGPETEPEPNFHVIWKPCQNRNRFSEPRVPETAVFGQFHEKIERELKFNQ